MAELFLREHVGCSFATLPAKFYTVIDPRPLSDPHLLHASRQVAGLLGLAPAALQSREFLDLCSGAACLPGVRPLATVYSGHQFGVWAGQLGDGRAHLLGEVSGPDGIWEIQLKGSGRTPYSRMGDGWAVLRSSVREYLASEAMAGLGIPTTRALALVGSADPVVREVVETAAIVTRVAPSFVRFGHFERWAHDPEAQATLLRYVIERFYPECLVGTAAQPDLRASAACFLEAVTRRTAQLVAQWQLVGFCHGVMNTDNMSVLGLTLDYGPFGFMDAFAFDHVCNHSDTMGRYAWNAQPAVARWNLYRLAGSLLTLGCAPEALEAALSPFEDVFIQAYHDTLARKWGLERWMEQDVALEDAWWELLAQQKADFTLAFRYLADGASRPERWLSLFQDAQAARAWLERYQTRLVDDPVPAPRRRRAMDGANPLYILRNHLAQQAIAAAQQGDVTEIDRLMQRLRNPYDVQPDSEAYAAPPAADVEPVAVSCSS